MKSASLQYANALADIAIAQGAAEPVLKQLNDFGASYADSDELRNFLSSPAVTRDAKHGVIEKIIARMGASRILRNFLFIIADRQRMHMLPEIIAAFPDQTQLARNPLRMPVRVSHNGTREGSEVPLLLMPDETVNYIVERCAATGEAYLPEQVEAVMDCQLDYLRFIGAIGRPVDEDEPGPDPTPTS